MVTNNSSNQSNPISVGSGGTGLSTLTSQSLYVGNGSSAPTALGSATNGQLPIGSTGANPTLAALTAGSGISVTNGAGSITIAGTAWVKITSATATDSATLDFTNLASTYSRYLFVLQELIAATDGADLYIRISTDNGTTWKAGVSDYAYANMTNNANGTTATSNSGGATQIICFPTVDNASTSFVSGQVGSTDPAQTGSFPNLDWHLLGRKSDATTQSSTGGGIYAAAGAINGVRFLMSSGNITSGKITLYGFLA